MRKITGFMFWVLFGLGIVIIPIACASDNNGNDGSPQDMAGKADSMTKT
jgi:hypothetical protein